MSVSFQGLSEAKRRPPRRCAATLADFLRLCAPLLRVQGAVLVVKKPSLLPLVPFFDRLLV